LKFNLLTAFPTVHWNHNWERQHELIFRLSRKFQAVNIHQPYGLINYSLPHVLKKFKDYWVNRQKIEKGLLANPTAENFHFVNHFYLPIHYTWWSDCINYQLVSSKAFPPEESLIYSGYVNGFMFKYFQKGGFKWLDLFARRQKMSELSVKAKNLEAKAVETADLVTADNVNTISDYMSIRKDILYLPQGVDAGRFYPTTGMESIKSLAKGYKGIAGYMGTDLAVDLQLLSEVIRLCPEIFFVFIGNFKNSTKTALNVYKNVVFTGRIGYFELNEAVNSLDIGIIPYLINEKTSGVFPTKYYEYLACNKPVITTPLPDLVDKNSLHVIVAEDARSWRDAMYFLLKKPYEPNAPISEAMHNTWARRLELLEGYLPL
jgi:glycosyltransferase involved in cell wall biosynthesis